MYRPALALLLCSHIEVQNAWNEEQHSSPQLPLFNWKMTQCHVEEREFGRCASQEELLLSFHPISCCCNPFCQTSQGDTGLAACQCGCTQDLLTWLLAHHCQLCPAQQHGSHFVSVRPSSSHGLSAKPWLWEVHLHFKQRTDEEYDEPNL